MTKGWEINNARTFTACGETCADVVKKLRDALEAAGIKNRYMSELSLHVAFEATEGNFEGIVTVIT